MRNAGISSAVHSALVSRLRHSPFEVSRLPLALASAAALNTLLPAVPPDAGSKACRLLLLGSGLPLGVLPHLLVHTFCLALALADAPAACVMPVSV